MGIKENLGKLIRKLRGRTGLTQTEFGREFDPHISGATVSRWESGHHMPESEHMEKVLDLADEHGMLASFMSLRATRRLKDQLDAESYAARVRESIKQNEVQETHEMGEYTIHLLVDGSLLVDDLVHIFPQ